MGYTHYWAIKDKPMPAQWDKVLSAKNDITQYVITNYDIPLEDHSTTSCIHLNGVGQDSCETFFLEPEIKDFNCCKTNGRPYDKVVVAILIAVKCILGAKFDASSDGSPDDWQDGLKLAQLACPSLNLSMPI